MKIDLSRDPLFQQKESPTKDLKYKQRERHRQMRGLRGPYSREKKQSNIEIVDPLPEELVKYKHELEYKKNFESSKASHKLKKYIIQQQRNLKCVRLDRIQLNEEEVQSSRVHRSGIQINLSTKSSKEKQDKFNKQINIPKIQQLFKNQQKQYVLYQSRMMRNQLSNAITLIDKGMNKLKSYSMTTPAPTAHNQNQNNGTTTEQHRRGSIVGVDKFPGLGASQVHFHNASNTHVNANNNAHANANANLNEEDMEIDKIIEKKMAMSKKLRDKLYREKKEMMTHQAKQSSQSQNLAFFLNIPKKPKKRVILQGVKSITFCQGNRKLQITPASSLLFSMNKMSSGRDRKQVQLQGLIQNSYQNRESILSQKSTFYQTETPFNNLSPSNQFKLRQLMDKKLMHRLELSKEQVNKFTAYLSEIKEYHVILNDTILQILREVRECLMTGKVMKNGDLAAIVAGKDRALLGGYPNEVILGKLADMMV